MGHLEVNKTLDITHISVWYVSLTSIYKILEKKYIIRIDLLEFHTTKFILNLTLYQLKITIYMVYIMFWNAKFIQYL